MPRELTDWIESYKEYVIPVSEAPEDFHEWVALSTLAAATRRRVWINMRIFEWVTNLYIVFVGPPGIVTKSTAIGVGTSFLRKIPAIKIGKESSTWQKLIEDLAESTQPVPYKDAAGRDQKLLSSALTLSISELGTFLKTRDDDMTTALTRLWDGQKDVFEHGTKSNGDTRIENPWLNLIGGTTPEWISKNFTEAMIGGGFASRVLFIPGEEKSKLVAYPDEMSPGDNFLTLERLLHKDLSLISSLGGPMTFGKDVREWGRHWYANHWNGINEEYMASGRFDGYRARKWTIIQKLAMLYSISRSDERVVTMPDIQRALKVLGMAESNMSGVLESVSTTRESKHIKELFRHIKFHGWILPEELYRKLVNVMTKDDFKKALEAGCEAKVFVVQDRREEGGRTRRGLSPPGTVNPLPLKEEKKSSITLPVGLLSPQKPKGAKIVEFD